MQHLNNDMDELFRKAAEDYPLNTGIPDWNKVAEGLSQETAPEPVVKKTYRRYTWLLLLLPLGFILTEIAQPGTFRRIVSGNHQHLSPDVSESKKLQVTRGRIRI